MTLKSLLPGGRNGSPASWDQDPFFAFHRSMNRVFDDMFRTFSSERSGGIDLRLDLRVTDKGAEITAELPGVDEKDISIELIDDVLTVRGEKKMEKTEERKDYHIAERSYGLFQRAVQLPWRPDPDKVQARFEKGILHVSLEKPAEAESKTRKIPISGAGTA